MGMTLSSIIPIPLAIDFDRRSARRMRYENVVMKDKYMG